MRLYVEEMRMIVFWSEMKSVCNFKEKIAARWSDHFHPDQMPNEASGCKAVYERA